jgi:SAM-dependent methyltransferase/tetratricopeptide (TPR) repeat protein
MGEKKRRLAAQTPGSALYYAELIRQGFRALEAGDRARAGKAVSELFSASKVDADVLNGAGLLGIRLGQQGTAEKLLLCAIEQRPGHPLYRCTLAMALRDLGKPGPALEQINIALGIDPGLAEAHATLGSLLLDSGNIEAAAGSFERALAIRGKYPDALNGLGRILSGLGQYDRSCAKFELALAIDPAFHQAHANLAAARFAWASSLDRSSMSDNASFSSEHATLGIQSISAALGLCPDNPAYWAQFADHLEYLDLRHPIGELARGLLLRALEHPAVEPAKLVRPISGLALTHPSAVEIERRLPRSGTFDTVAWSDVKHLAGDVFGDPLLLHLIEDVVVRDVFLERLIAFSRRAALEEFLERPTMEPSLSLAAMAAIAHQSFNTEYVCEESEEERSGVEVLRNAILSVRKAGEPVRPGWYAVFACYRPLHLLDGAERIAADLAPTPLASLALRQILEPLDERRLRATIPALTGTADGVSLAVQAQYEANPYPRWLRTAQNAAAGTVAGVLRRLFPLASLNEVTDAPARILVAGCGTGLHPITTARRFENSSVLAVDLSLTSLAYAKRKTLEFGIENIEYRQGDILALDSIPERFDVIECSGVLHHLEDPLAGWRILCSLMRPGGVMRIGLYSESGRRHVARAREFAAAQGFEPTPEGIRRCRAAILARGDDELLARTARSEDFYSLSGCRDLIFHVQEHMFTLPRIASLIEGLGLRFIGFELPDAGAVFARYKAQFPDDPARVNLEYWHRFEQANPETFARMYQFWVCRKPGAADGNPQRI